MIDTAQEQAVTIGRAAGGPRAGVALRKGPGHGPSGPRGPSNGFVCTPLPGPALASSGRNGTAPRAGDEVGRRRGGCRYVAAEPRLLSAQSSTSMSAGRRREGQASAPRPGAGRGPRGACRPSAAAGEPPVAVQGGRRGAHGGGRHRAAWLHDHRHRHRQGRATAPGRGLHPRHHHDRPPLVLQGQRARPTAFGRLRRLGRFSLDRVTVGVVAAVALSLLAALLLLAVTLSRLSCSDGKS